MKKFIFMMIMAFSAIVVNAQTAVQTSKVFDNTYVGIEGGVATPLAFDHVFPLNSTATLHVGKLFTPVIGAEVEGTAWFGSHDFGGTLSRFDTYGAHNAFRGLYVGVNGLVNLTNLLYGYNGTPRKFELSAVAGTGWIHTFTLNQSDKANNGLGVKTGLDFAFNLGKEKAHTISVRPAVLWNVTHSHTMPLTFCKNSAQLYLGVGYTYHFKTSNGTHHFKVYDVDAMQDEINRLREEVAKKPTEVVREREIVKEVTKVVNSNEYVVYFAYNSDVLTSDAKATLDNVSGTVKVNAYASPEGTKKYNKDLSQRRANAVANYLRGKNVTVTEIVGLGVVGEASNRVAVVTVQ